LLSDYNGKALRVIVGFLSGVKAVNVVIELIEVCIYLSSYLAHCLLNIEL
jgi:hypothetical protein